ncbi:hypothetical protein A2954_04625 [Candidatus Roizmanbacteria bacterium RIFCSPLOWO2_01_FULL_37_12]|uniref:DUF5667 domain-containing protein n=1 Tax=Candidatus Roizmanbacteria bacterium RIFCSPLOWO2_01_FULL_37_12 TaxID=1802056 RepID=A0A1F7IFY3_9BACT|nr:MAG: hypothetical protein A2954_04625 [Candidatus Roizmanbacteria bacterium RIFCSPLOWO2_01_FULL_37_12]
MPGKNNLVLILFSLIFLAALPIFAQEFSPPVSPISVGKQKFPTGINPQQKRELLQQRLQSITDTRKAALVLNINDKIADINTRSTQQMTDVLNQMSDILSRLEGKMSVAQSESRDISLVEQALSEAKTSLKTAQDAVDSQSAKVYTIDASDSASLRAVVGNAVSQLQSDLRTVRTLIIEAKQKIAAVIRELAKTGVGKIGQRDRSASSAPALIEPFIPR